MERKIEEVYKTMDKLQMKENYEELKQISDYAIAAINNDIEDTPAEATE